MKTSSLRTAFYLASRSLRRGNAKILAMVVGIMCLVYLNLIFTPSLLEGLVFKTNHQLINTYSGHVVVESGGERSQLFRVADLVQDLEKVSGVEAVAPKTRLNGEIRYDGHAANWEVTAVDPVREAQVFAVKPALIEGSWLEPDDTDQIVLGVQIAGANRPELELYTDSLRDVRVGHKVEVRYADGQRREYTVKGIVAFDFIQADIRAFITQKELLSLNSLAQDRASSVHLKLDDSRSTETVVQELAFLRSELRFSTWQEKAGVIRNMTASFAKINSILTVLALAVAIMTISIVTYIDILDHRRQIGLKRAMGVSPLAIVLSYVMRAGVYAMVGMGVSWAAFRFALVPLVIRYPFEFPTGKVTLVYNTVLLANDALILAAVVICSALLASWRVSRLDLADAIWGE